MFAPDAVMKLFWKNHGVYVTRYCWCVDTARIHSYSSICCVEHPAWLLLRPRIPLVLLCYVLLVWTRSYHDVCTHTGFVQVWLFWAICFVIRQHFRWKSKMCISFFIMHTNECIFAILFCFSHVQEYYHMFTYCPVLLPFFPRRGAEKDTWSRALSSSF